MPISFLTNFILSLSILLGIHYLLFFNPIQYVYFVSEDWWAEYATFTCYACATGLMIWALVQNRALRKPGYLMLTAGFLFMALEEISWGQRIFSFTPPDYFKDNDFQQEINVHNFVRNWWTIRILILLVLLWAIFLPVAVIRSKHLRNLTNYVGIPIVSLSLLPSFLCFLYFYSLRLIPRWDESGEMLLAISFLAFSLHTIFEHANKDSLLKAFPKSVFAFMMMCCVVLTTWFLVMNWASTSSHIISENIFRVAQFHIDAGRHDQAMTLFNYVDNNPYYRTEKVLFQHYDFLMTTKREQQAKKMLNSANSEMQTLIQVNPQRIQPHITMARIQSTLGNQPLGQSELQTAIKLLQHRLEQTTSLRDQVTIQLQVIKLYMDLEEHQTAKDLLERLKRQSLPDPLMRQVVHVEKKFLVPH